MAFNQDLMIQLLLGAGGALGGQGSWQQAAGGVMKNYKASKEYSGMLQQLLGGLPQDAKISGDNKGLTLKLPVSTLSTGETVSPESGLQNMNPFITGQQEGAINTKVGGINKMTGASTAGTTPTGTSGGFLNPFKVR